MVRLAENRKARGDVAVEPKQDAKAVAKNKQGNVFDSTVIQTAGELSIVGGVVAGTATLAGGPIGIGVGVAYCVGRGVQAFRNRKA